VNERPTGKSCCSIQVLGARKKLYYLQRGELGRREFKNRSETSLRSSCQRPSSKRDKEGRLQTESQNSRGWKGPLWVI